MTLPATAPTMISISATEMAAQIDIRDAARVTCKGRRGPLPQPARQNTAASGRLAAGEELAHAIERLEDVLGRIGIGEPHVAFAENAEVRPPDNRNTCILQQGRGERLRLP